MDKLQIVVLILTFSLILTGCSEKEDTGPDITSLWLKLSKDRIVGDSLDFAIVSVTNQADKNVMEYVTIYYKGEKINSDKLKSCTPSVSTVYAMYNDIRSNEEEFEVVEDVNLKFRKNTFLEQYTGTWCGWCPRAIYQISALQQTDKQVIHVAYHLNDEMTFNLNSTLFQSFGFTGIPTVHADRNIVWQGEVSEITKLHSPSRIGISMEVTGNTSSISASVNTKFGYDFTEELKLSVFLIHDSLIANQTNYYNTDPASPFYQAGSSMINFVHRNIMLKSGTDIFGDLIPALSIDLGGTYSKKIDFTNFSCNDIGKMVVIAFITYGGGPWVGQVINAAEARVGQTLEFVYAEK